MERLQRAIALITDGQQVDWEGLMEDARDPAERRLIAELRGLAQLDADRAIVTGPEVDASVGVPAPRPASPARRWSHLELLDELGRGAYGVVYRAWDTRLAREVALKLLHDTDAARSLDEARSLARVSHPNVVTVYGAGRFEGQVGLWMQLLRGRSLDEILSAQGPFSGREATAIGVEICGAVAAIHAAGLIHRDVKAQNVVREPGGRLVLMDMGASAPTSSDESTVQSFAGTPLYMAPELFEGGAASVSSDIYAIGVLLYRLVTADFPVAAATIGELRHALAHTPMRSLRDAQPALSPRLVAVINRCLAHSPRERYSAVGDLERALLAVDRPTVAGGSAWRPVSTLALAAAVGAGLAWSYGALRENQRRDGSSTTAGVGPQEYKLYSGYEELAFSKREADPRGAIGATDAATALIRSALPGTHPVYALLYARIADLWRRAGDPSRAAAAARDGATHILESIGDNHPFAAVVAMEEARNAQAAGASRAAAEAVRRALNIRARLIGLQEEVCQDMRTLEQAVGTASLSDDANRDGLIDALAVALGRRPRFAAANASVDAEANLTACDRLVLQVKASPFLTWGQAGARDPRSSGWQAAAHFPMVERSPSDHGEGWSIAAAHSMAFFHQRLAPAQSMRALEHGFLGMIRVEPVGGLSTFSVDTSPHGPRFDVLARRIDDRSIEVRLPSSIVPREGPTIVIPAAVGDRSPVLELRYDAQSKVAALFVDGRLVRGGYAGHRQFQEPAEGVVSWGVAAVGDGDTRAAGAFSLVWLEIF